MRAKSPVLLILMAWGCGIAPVQALADTGEATARVSVEVAPHLAISGPAAVTIGLQDYPSGSIIPAQIQFSVCANTQEVDLYVAGTDLYHAGNPRSAHRIPLAGPGVQITCENGHQTAGGSGLLPWQDTSEPSPWFPDWTGALSEVGTFTTTGTSVFSQNVTVDVSWQAIDPELPSGEYSGFVRLIGMVRP